MFIAVGWLMIWIALIATEAQNMVDSHQDLDRVPGQHIIVRLIDFDGIENILGKYIRLPSEFNSNSWTCRSGLDACVV